MADIMEYPGGITGGHMKRTGRYIGILLDMLENEKLYPEATSSWNRDSFIESSLIHDLGKISIDNKIIFKPGKLTNAEFEEIKTHTLAGIHIIDDYLEKSGSSKFLVYARIFIGTHHEWWDGSGYPYGLKGREIPLQGRLMALADVYDALISERPYKKAFSHEEAVALIAEGRGSHFDPVLSDLFLLSQDLFEEASRNIPQEDVPRNNPA
jgi:putative two-component system response regulator